jgi:hypothetical protein
MAKAANAINLIISFLPGFASHGGSGVTTSMSA